MNNQAPIAELKQYPLIPLTEGRNIESSPLAINAVVGYYIERAILGIDTVYTELGDGCYKNHPKADFLKGILADVEGDAKKAMNAVYMAYEASEPDYEPECHLYENTNTADLTKDEIQSEQRRAVLRAFTKSSLEMVSMLKSSPVEFADLIKTTCELKDQASDLSVLVNLIDSYAGSRAS